MHNVLVLLVEEMVVIESVPEINATLVLLLALFVKICLKLASSYLFD